MDTLSLKSSSSSLKRKLTRKLTFKKSKSDTDLLYIQASSSFLLSKKSKTVPSCSSRFSNLSTLVTTKNHSLDTFRSREIESLITCHPTSLLLLLFLLL
ncbi:unnamed protein product [Cunninghamella echinulata]